MKGKKGKRRKGRAREERKGKDRRRKETGEMNDGISVPLFR